MLPRTDSRRLQRDVWLAIMQVLLAVLLTAIYLVFVTSFGGEFLLVVKGALLLPVFVLAVVTGTVVSLVLAIRSRRRGEFLGDVSATSLSPRARTVWLIVWSVVLMAMAYPLLVLGRTLALGAMGAVPTAALVVLLLPYVGYASLFLVGGVLTLIRLLRRHPVRLMRGAVLIGMPFLLLFIGFGVIAAMWSPQWTTGVQSTPLFSPGDQPGRSYRIPAMLVLPGDTVLAFAESRQEAMSDLLDIDIVLRRSVDAARTWGPIEIVQDLGTQTVHSPSPVFDASTDTVWLAYCTDYSTLFLTSSPDRGTTWTAARNLSNEIGIPNGTWCHNGPGNGIVLPTGRLVIPTDQGDPRALFSDDHGVTWQLGGSMGSGEEPAVIATVDGAVCANLRNARGEPRLVTCSGDGGLTWPPSAPDAHLVDAGTQASLMRFTGAVDGERSRMLFSNPGAPYRGEMTLRISYDEGATWPVGRLLYEGAAGYSQIGVLSDHTILVLFETGRYDLRQSITLARVDLDWLTQGADVLQAP